MPERIETRAVPPAGGSGGTIPGPGGGYLLAALIGLACLALPIAWTDVPPLMDYPGHLSRVHVLFNLLHGGGFQDAYAYRFIVTPNLAVDAICLGLMEAGLPAEGAGRVFIAMAVLALGSGVLALHRAVFRRWSCWPLLALPFIYHEMLFHGFVSYFFGLGLAFWGMAVWRMARPDDPGRNVPRRAWAGLFLFATLLFFCHLVALLILLGVVIGTELAAAIGVPPGEPGGRRRATVDLAVTVLAGVLPLGLLAFGPLLGADNPLAMARMLDQIGLAPLYTRLAGLRSVFWGYDPTLDRVSALLVLGAIGVAVALGRLRVRRRLLLPFAGLLAVYFVIPSDLFGTSYVSERLPIVLWLLAFAASDVRCPRRGIGRHALLGLAIGLAMARGAAVTRAWVDANTGFAPILRVFDTVPAGTRIYSANATTGNVSGLNRRPFGSLPGYAVVRRNAYFAGTFADPSQNLVFRTPTYRAAGGHLTNFHGTLIPGVNDPFDAKLLAFFDYLLLVNPRLWPGTPPPALLPVLTSPEYVLYRIRHDDGAPPRQ